MKPLHVLGMNLVKGSLAIALAATASTIAVVGTAPLCEPAWAADENAMPSADADDEAAELTIVAGPAERNGNEYRFPKLKVTSNTDKNIRSITVQFTTAIAAGDDVTFDAVEGFEVRGKTANRSVNATNADEKDGGWPAAKWEEYLQKHMKVTLAGGSGTKGLRMIASLKPVTDTYDFNSENGHYYRYIPQPSTWLEARDAAAADTYMGLQGYLVTVTSPEESNFITTLIDTNMWMGGTAEPTFGAVGNTGRFTWQKPSAGWPYSFYWVTGPEATMGPDGGPMEICRMDSAGSAKPVKDPVTEGNAYYNFASSEPNNAANIGYYDNAGTQRSGEYCLHMYSQKNSADVPTAAANIGKWNDYPNFPNNAAHQKCCYVIEYGGLEDDSAPGGDGDGSGGDADVNVDVDVYVKVDINVDPEELTITTEADSITLGQALKVSENINGGVLDPVADRVERTYVLVDANGKEIIGDDGKPIVVPEAEVPYTAGRYKVTSTKPNREDGSVYKEGTAIFTVRPATVDLTREKDASGAMQPKVYEKVYDGTADFSLDAIALPGILPTHSGDVRLAADSASYGTADAGDGKIVLEGARLESADGTVTTNYTLAGLKDDGTLELVARIVPRELVVTASSTVKWGLAGKPLADESGVPLTLTSNEDVHDDGSAPWTTNMLAPRDAARVDGGAVESILGAVELTCTRDSDGEPLDASNPTVGTYTATPHFANVNPRANGAAAAFTMDGSRAAGFPSPITEVKDLGGGRYDIGNYLLTLKPAKVVVTANPATDPDLGQIGDLIEGGTVEEDVTPGKPPVSKDELEDVIKDQIEGNLPNTDPVITIIKDGEEVETIDPTKPGHYVVIATYPDPDGGPDKVVRFEYTVAEPTPDEPQKPEKPGTPDKPTAPGASQPDQGNVIVDENVTVTVDPNGKPLTKDDIAADIHERWPDRVPADVKPEITITLDGKTVDSIDPTRPGTYYVTAVYPDPNGGPDRIVRFTYTVEERDGTTIRLKHLLAQTGDAAPMAVAGAMALGAAVTLAVSAARRRKDRRNS